MTKSSTEITVTELAQLLTSIKNSPSDIKIRVRLIGELWQKAFMKVEVIEEDSIILCDTKTNDLLSFDDIQSVIQFELDKPFQHYKPQLHYTVKLA
jgi:hypothetical protein